MKVSPEIHWSFNLVSPDVYQSQNDHDTYKGSSSIKTKEGVKFPFPHKSAKFLFNTHSTELSIIKNKITPDSKAAANINTTNQQVDFIKNMSKNEREVNILSNPFFG